ncbi:MAG: nucleotidyl transferase AbiEii/AbiGii toxin family protein [Tepidisphaerales bacterium]
MPYLSEAASPGLLDVLHRLSSAPALDAFYLVGGTALALQIGHRRSVDIDLFTHAPFDSQAVADWMVQNVHAAEVDTGKNTVRCFVDGVKVDILAHQYPPIEPLVTIDWIRMASLQDIVAMKLNAVSNRGAKKDFWDVAALLSHFSLEEMLDFYRRKYPSGNAWTVIKSLAYFQEAEAEDVPIHDLTGMTWEQVKHSIRQASGRVLRHGG